MSQIHLNIDKAFSQLNSLDESSAPRRECDNPKLLKSSAVTLSCQLFLIYIPSMKVGKLPLAWKHSLLDTLFKSGSQNSPLTYRPDRLTSFCCKIMERLLGFYISLTERDTVG